MKTKTDICLILEGTYPYVAGGVSTWVHQLISGLSEFTFSLVVILPNTGNWQPKYDLPENIKEIAHIYLHDSKLPADYDNKIEPEIWQDVELFHTCAFGEPKLDAFESVFRGLCNSDTRGIAPTKVLHTKQAWNIVSKLYNKKAMDESFIDYFWTFRFIHLPLFKILTSELPLASVYHTVSTGYAGLLAVVGKLKYDRPLILTEHGIYTRERRFEISRAEWIYENEDHRVKVQRSQSRFKELWNKMFGNLSKLCYDYADQIITLFEGNRFYQLEGGALQEKTRLIPNGIDFESFHQIQKEEKNTRQLVIGFMGRVVSIKDVKTFIRACKHVSANIANFKAYIMGPTDEEEGYYQECVKLSDFLGLHNIIEFTGKVDVKKYYPKIDILVLTSISEAQPLVILEANSMGIPVVATDVGACKELLYGMTEEDKALGKSGLIAGITNSEEIGNNIIKIWQSKDLRDQMAEAGIERVKRYYDRTNLINDYRDIYKQYF